MDLAPHALSERAVDELMARDGALTGKLGCNDAGREMRAVGGLHPHVRSGKPGPDELCYFFGIHRHSLADIIGA